ncbi:hypothetical protein C8F01DRAFT_1021249 [Mycena amicta]|nr:hypothetical protein C8F01DRAFT_1021249 [Mycena amicta]
MIIPQKEDLPPPVPSGSRPPSYKPSFPFAHEPATTAREKTEERYVYYRVYHPSGALPCHTAFSSDPFLGRLRARSIPPPHTVATLKRCMRAAEGYDEDIDWLLALYDGYALEAMLDGTRMAILSGTGGNGMGVETALVLLLPDSVPARSTPSGWTAPSQQMLNAFGPFVYYRLYTQTNEDTSILALSPSEPSLGRISTIRIAPPYTLHSLLRCVASPSAEDKLWYSQADVFPSMDAVDPVALDTPLNSLPGGLCDVDGTVVVPPRTTEENPLILVRPSSATNTFSTEQGNPNATSLLRRARTVGSESSWLIRQRGRMAAADSGAQPLTSTVRWQGGMLNGRPVKMFSTTAGAPPRFGHFPFISQSRPSEAVNFNLTPFVGNGRQPEDPPTDSPATGEGNNTQTHSETVDPISLDAPLNSLPGGLCDIDGTVVVLPGTTEENPLILVRPSSATNIFSTEQGNQNQNSTSLLRRARTGLIRQRAGMAAANNHGAQPLTRTVRWQGGMLNDRPVRLFSATAGAPPRLGHFPFIGQSRPSEAVNFNPTPFIENGRQPEDPPADSPATGEGNNAQTHSEKHSNQGTTRYHRDPPIPMPPPPPAGTAPLPFDSTAAAIDEPDSDLYLELEQRTSTPRPRPRNANRVVGVVGVGGFRGVPGLGLGRGNGNGKARTKVAGLRIHQAPAK